MDADPPVADGRISGRRYRVTHCGTITQRAQLTRYLPGRPPATLPAGQPYNPRLQQLEPLIEREPVRPRPGAIAGLVQSAEAGLHFLRLAGQTYRDRLVRTYPMPTLTPQQQAQADSDSLQFLRMMAGRVPDGTRMFTAWRQGTLVTTPLFTANGGAGRAQGGRRLGTVVCRLV